MRNGRRWRWPPRGAATPLAWPGSSPPTPLACSSGGAGSARRPRSSCIRARASSPVSAWQRRARGRDQREHLLDLLALAREGRGAGLAATIEEYGAARPSDALVLLTPALSPDLLDLCARLRRLGCGVAAVLLDAASFGGALLPPD